MSTSLDSSPTPTSGTPDWSRFRSLLEEHRSECAQQREEALVECAQSVPDDVALARSASLQQTLEQIDSALARLAAGTYGRCVHCGAAIPEERLELRPFTDTCVACTAVR